MIVINLQKLREFIFCLSIEGLTTVYNDTEGMIYSPYFMNKLLNRSETYFYRIEAGTGMRIYLGFTYIRFGSDITCSKTSLSIYEGTNATGVAKEVRCGGNTTEFVSATNIITVKYATKEESLTSIHGFEVYYTYGTNGEFKQQECMRY